MCVCYSPNILGASLTSLSSTNHVQLTSKLFSLYLHTISRIWQLAPDLLLLPSHSVNLLARCFLCTRSSLASAPCPCGHAIYHCPWVYIYPFLGSFSFLTKWMTRYTVWTPDMEGISSPHPWKLSLRRIVG